jgi:hypothetical protein
MAGRLEVTAEERSADAAVGTEHDHVHPSLPGQVDADAEPAALAGPDLHRPRREA